jgi:heptosyltransferase-2
MPPRTGFAEATYTPPFEQPLPSNREAYLRRASAFKLGWRRLRRTAYLALHGQLALQRERIESAHRRILFIHSGMPQVGDALMDLACRDLFRVHRGRHEVDLLINPHLLPLFAHDDVFGRVFGDPAEAALHEYDLAILLTASSHSLREKLRWFRALPFVHQIGFYNGPEFHRTLFGYYRMAQLLGLPAEPAQVLPIACPHMRPGEAAVQAVDALALPPRFVVMAVGGVRGWRTYEHWPAVLQALPADLPVVLVGSANGRAQADALLAAGAAQERRVIDRVDRHPLPEVYEILRRSAAVACADGGLLHVANAAKVPTVALFAERIDPSYRLTPANRSVAFHAPGEVSDTPPADVAAALLRAADGGVSGGEVVRVAEPAVRSRPVDTVDKRLR